MDEQQNKLQQYTSDMLSLERHIHQAIEQQLNDDNLKAQPEANQLVSELDGKMESHIGILENHLKALGGDSASPVKEAVSSALGVAAGLYDQVRGKEVSRALRDDYTALNLAAMGYQLLHTTALAFKDSTTADLALRHLNDYTPIIMRFNDVTVRVVTRELMQDHDMVDPSVADEAVRNTQQAWQS